MIVVKLVIGLWLLVVQVNPLAVTTCPIRYIDGGPVVSGPCVVWHAGPGR